MFVYDGIRVAGRDVADGPADDAAGGRRDRSTVVADLRRRLEAMGAGPRGVAGPQVTGPRADVGTRDEGGLRGAPASGVLPAPGPLAAVLPSGGLSHGSVVGVTSTAPGGSGAMSLLLSLLAAPRGAWIAVVGMPRFGVLAAAEMGVDLARLGLIPDPGDDLPQVLSVLADGVDVIATAPPPRLPPARQKVLAGRLRQSGAVLLVAGRWPGADVVFTVTEVRWSGIGRGHGRLRDRELDVRISGRRAGSAMGAATTLLLRAAGPDAVAVQAPASGPDRRRTVAPSATRDMPPATAPRHNPTAVATVREQAG